MDFEVRREMVTSLDDEELQKLYERDARKGKFWFRLSLNGCSNADKLYLYLLGIGLLDFQARQTCVDFGEYANDNGEIIAELYGMKEREVMSFMIKASSDEELEEKLVFFVEGVKRMKETVSHCLLHQVPKWVTEVKRITV